MAADAGEKRDGRGARGREAERLAARFLEGEGYEVLARNHRIPRGEVDLVCTEKGVLCFVEVRSRTSEAQGGPEETIGSRKMRRVIAAATDWALQHGGLARDMRFDVVAVTFAEDAEPRLDLFRGAFDGDAKPGHW